MRRFHLKLYKGKISPLMMNLQIVLCRAKALGASLYGNKGLARWSGLWAQIWLSLAPGPFRSVKNYCLLNKISHDTLQARYHGILKKKAHGI